MKPLYYNTFSMLARIHRMGQMMKHTATGRDMAQSEEVSTRTIRRTIEFMREGLGWEIDGDEHGYTLKKYGAFA